LCLRPLIGNVIYPPPADKQIDILIVDNRLPLAAERVIYELWRCTQILEMITLHRKLLDIGVVESRSLHRRFVLLEVSGDPGNGLSGPALRGRKLRSCETWPLGDRAGKFWKRHYVVNCFVSRSCRDRGVVSWMPSYFMLLMRSFVLVVENLICALLNCPVFNVALGAVFEVPKSNLSSTLESP